MNVLTEDKISKNILEKITNAIQNNVSKQPVRNSNSLRSRQGSKKSYKKNDSIRTESTSSVHILHFNKNKNKKVKFKQEFEDVVFIDNYKEYHPSNLGRFRNEDKGNENKMNQICSFKENGESGDLLDRKFNHKETKNNCSVCCNIF